MQSNIAQIEVTNNKRFMLPINIIELLEQNRIESNRIEYKQGWNPTAIYHTICAFANDFENLGGGYIVVGA